MQRISGCCLRLVSSPMPLCACCSIYDEHAAQAFIHNNPALITLHVEVVHGWSFASWSRRVRAAAD